jgi:hypothetical protein
VFSARRRCGELRKAKPASAALLTGVEDAGPDGVAAVEEAADERRADEAAGAGDQHRLPLGFPARHVPMFPPPCRVEVSVL